MLLLFIYSVDLQSTHKTSLHLWSESNGMLFFFGIQNEYFKASVSIQQWPRTRQVWVKIGIRDGHALECQSSFLRDSSVKTQTLQHWQHGQMEKNEWYCKDINYMAHSRLHMAALLYFCLKLWKPTCTSMLEHILHGPMFAACSNLI